MPRFFALLMLVLLVALVGNGRAASCGGEAPCGTEHAVAVESGGCCESDGCSCEAAPGRDDAPVSPALPAQGCRVLDCAMVARVAVVVGEAVFEEREATVPARGESLLPPAVRRTILHCSFLI